MKQVDAIILSCFGYELTSSEKKFFKKINPFGFILFKRNFKNKEQIKKLIQNLKEATLNADLLIFIDQEGGRVQRLNNHEFTKFPTQIIFGAIYKKDKKVFIKLKKIFPKYISSFPINKKEIINLILDKKSNLKKIVKILHLEVRKKMYNFIKQNKGKKIIVLDIPLLLENKINKKSDILIFVDSKKSDILKKLSKRKNFNKKLHQKFKEIQMSSRIKKKKSKFVIKNDFKKKTIDRNIRTILNKIL